MVVHMCENFRTCWYTNPYVLFLDIKHVYIIIFCVGYTCIYSNFIEDKVKNVKMWCTRREAEDIKKYFKSV